MLGQVQNRFPRLTLTLAGQEASIPVEFIVDTGFDGEIALPASLLRRLRYRNGERRDIRLADGTLEGHPLLGIELLEGHTLCVEVVSGGEVSVEEI